MGYWAWAVWDGRWSRATKAQAGRLGQDQVKGLSECPSPGALPLGSSSPKLPCLSSLKPHPSLAVDSSGWTL